MDGFHCTCQKQNCEFEGLPALDPWTWNWVWTFGGSFKQLCVNIMCEMLQSNKFCVSNDKKWYVEDQHGILEVHMVRRST